MKTFAQVTVEEPQISFEGIPLKLPTVDSDLMNEASVMKPDYVKGMKFMYVGKGFSELDKLGYKRGDVFEIIPNLEDREAYKVFVSTDETAPIKTLSAPKGETIGLQGSTGYKSAAFTHVKASGSPPSGAEWEDCIVFAYNNLNNTKTESSVVETAMKYQAQFGETATTIAHNFNRKLKTSQLVHTGKGGLPVSLGKFWKQSGATNKTPKTDIASNDFKEKISLKKSGGSQLASAEKKEAIAIVNQALSMMGEDKKFAQGLTQQLGEKMDRLVSGETVTSLRKRAKAGESDEAIIDFQKKDKDNKELSAVLRSFINQDNAMNTLFSKHIVLEAATGNGKFGGAKTKPAANLLAKFDTGTQKVDVRKIESISSSIIVEYSTKVKPYVAFKKSGGAAPAYASMRLSLEDYSSFKGIVLQELNKIEECKSLLTEEFLEESALDMLRKAKSTVQDMGSKAWKKLENAVKKIMMQVRKVLKKIANAGRRFFALLLRFLGLEVESAGNIVSGISL